MGYPEYSRTEGFAMKGANMNTVYMISIYLFGFLDHIWRISNNYISLKAIQQYSNLAIFGRVLIF